MTTALYILELANQKYYIGKTNKPVHERIAEHFNGTGAEWTKLHKPLRLAEIKNDIDDYDEDKYTKIYMRKYGIENVRGGSYVTIVLSDYQKLALEKELCTVENKCFKCNKEGHYASTCPNITDKIVPNQSSSTTNSFSATSIFGSLIKTITDYTNPQSDPFPKKFPANKEKDVCYRCGRKGHWATNCYAKTHIKGYALK